jgi:hypothetical protein
MRLVIVVKPHRAIRDIERYLGVQAFDMSVAKPKVISLAVSLRVEHQAPRSPHTDTIKSQPLRSRRARV